MSECKRDYPLTSTFRSNNCSSARPRRCHNLTNGESVSWSTSSTSSEETITYDPNKEFQKQTTPPISYKEPRRKSEFGTHLRKGMYLLGYALIESVKFTVRTIILIVKNTAKTIYITGKIIEKGASNYKANRRIERNKNPRRNYTPVFEPEVQTPVKNNWLNHIKERKQVQEQNPQALPLPNLRELKREKEPIEIPQNTVNNWTKRLQREDDLQS